MTFPNTGAQVVIADIATASFEQFLNFGIPASTANPYSNTEEERRRGMLGVLAATGYSFSADTTTKEISVTLSAGSFPTLGAMASDFRSKLADEIRTQPETGDGRKILVLNLIPFRLSPTRMDKIAPELFSSTVESTLLGRFDVILILLRNIDWALKSEVFLKELSGITSAVDICLLDVRPFGARVAKDGSHIDIAITGRPFSALFDTSPNRIYQTLITETNSHIGHFGLRSAHVRTHYDLSQFVQNDNVWEFFVARFERLLGGADSLLLILVGMEQTALSRIGEQLAATLGQRISVELIRDPTAKIETTIPQNWSEQFEVVIVVTDIVCTGKTIEPWIEGLTRTNKRSRPIKLFAVAALQNSEPSIKGVPLDVGVRIRRDYYPTVNKECPLCISKQPLLKVERVEDFHKSAGTSLTPLDFWEIVTDSSALERDVTNARGQILAYRINTAKIVRRYAQWLRNLIAARVEENWPDSKFNFICAVNEKVSSAFTDLVANCLNVPVVLVDRPTLNGVTASGGLPRDVKPQFGHGDRILIVDDGMNSGDTMYDLIEYCRASGPLASGALVMDSRLDEKGILKLRKRMARNHIVSLYTWQGDPSALRGNG